ncbi:MULTISPECIES: B12-binding domain-containing protein [Desulfitobacterium]|uniref:Cobalamin-binding protein n=2 Tax=Desulfitobacterium dehalogenans TaxID=36854 RepID=A0A7C7D893_9FIRM|nr:MULTISPECIES: cobalamin-dependent protein [Desulfitobacterium]AFM00714.1 putative cobalamin binding protein [Desulfitobacterium dehalogenans ATCC 51507]HHY28736.1 cobalamin-binding protein [Desulfitobacterium dehalogenans]
MDDGLVNALADLDEEKTINLVKKHLSDGDSPLKVVELCQKGVEVVGRRYCNGEYYLSDLIMSEEILKEVMVILEPLITTDIPSNGMTIILGTIEGDIHDLGKNIIHYMLKSSGFKVVDLGVDVSPEAFVQAVNETKAPVLGISVLLSFCVSAVKKVVDLLTESGLRDQVKIIVGGYPVNEIVKDYTGVDYYTNDITKLFEICQMLKDEVPTLREKC